MKKLSFILTMFVGLFLASCSTGRYVPTSFNQNLNQTQVVLSEANFRVVKHVSTSVVFRRSLRFDSKQLSQSAYAALVRKAKLTGSQVLINITMEQVQRVSGVWVLAEDNAILVSGTVIEFIDKDTPSQSTETEDTEVVSGGTIVVSSSQPQLGESIAEIENIPTKTSNSTEPLILVYTDKSDKQFIKDLLNTHKTATLVVEDEDLPKSWIKRYQTNFLKTFNSTNTTAFRLTTDSQNLVVKLTFTDRTNERQTAHVVLIDKTGQALVSYDLGNEATIQTFAKKFAKMVQEYSK